MSNDTGMRPMQLYLSEGTPKFLEDFAHHAMSHLGIDRLRGEINIYYCKKLEEESYGLCWGDRREAEIHLAHTQWGETLSREDRMMSLAHELAHAWQYLTGKLVADPDRFVAKWEGTNIEYTPENEKYMPWEIEAVEYENRIYASWVEDKNLYK